LCVILQILDGRSCWATLILAFRSLIDCDEDRIYVIYNGGLQMAFEVSILHKIISLHTLKFQNEIFK
jgi:hypothetical protein